MPAAPNTSRQEFERTVLKVLRTSLAALPDVRKPDVEAVGQRGRDSGIDMIATAEVDGRPIRVLVQVKTSGYPRDILNAVPHLRKAAAAYEQPAVLLLAAPALSSGSRELLREEGIGYWDTSGSLYLRLPHALYFIDRPVPKLEQRRLRGVYRGRSAQVLHALLLAPVRWWGVRELAAHAGVSPYTVHQVFAFLEEQLWAERRGTGPGTARRLEEPGALLDAWAEAHSLAEYVPHRFHSWARSPAALLREVAAELERADVEYALTLASGAQFVAPFGTAAEPVTVLVSPSADIAAIAPQAKLRPVDEGETVTLLATKEQAPLLFRRKIDGVWVASDVQLYLDLWAWPKRGKEQALHLRTERLPY